MSEDKQIVEIEERKDGFRPRKLRPDGWYVQAIKDGVIPDPDNPVEPATPSGTVVEAPTAKAIVSV